MPQMKIYAWVTKPSVCNEYGRSKGCRLWFYMYGYKVSLARALNRVWNYPRHEVQRFATTSEDIKDTDIGREMIRNPKKLYLMDFETRKVVDSWEKSEWKVIG